MARIEVANGQYGNDGFKVFANNGDLVDAKYLVDGNGNYIIDNITQKPYIVPADYSIASTTDKYTQELQDASDPASGNTGLAYSILAPSSGRGWRLTTNI